MMCASVGYHLLRNIRAVTIIPSFDRELFPLIYN